MADRKEDLRKVKISKFHDGTGEYTINGYFHRFGDTVYTGEDGKTVGAVVAIVENEDGTVKKYNPERLMFVERF